MRWPTTPRPAPRRHRYLGAERTPALRRDPPAHPAGGPRRLPGGQAFRREIAFREFYADVLWHQPRTARASLDTRFDSAMDYASGPAAEAAFDAWCAGRTGYPFVDAGMRQSLAEGWIDNRVRMVVASFLVKDFYTCRGGAGRSGSWRVCGMGTLPATSPGGNGRPAAAPTRRRITAFSTRSHRDNASILRGTTCADTCPNCATCQAVQRMNPGSIRCSPRITPGAGPHLWCLVARGIGPPPAHEVHSRRAALTLDVISRRAQPCSTDVTTSSTLVPRALALLRNLERTSLGTSTWRLTRRECRLRSFLLIFLSFLDLRRLLLGRCLAQRVGGGATKADHRAQVCRPWSHHDVRGHDSSGRRGLDNRRVTALVNHRRSRMHGRVGCLAQCWPRAGLLDIRVTSSWNRTGPRPHPTTDRTPPK